MEVSSFQEALNHINSTLNEVENTYTTIPFNPSNWMNDGRMYPFQPDSEVYCEYNNVRKFRSVSHYTYIGINGAFRIQEIFDEQNIIIDKRGKNKKKIDEL